MANPYVSIFLPTYSRLAGGYLERAISSVQFQTFEDWELLVVDDGSVDGSAELIRSRSAEDPRIRHVRNDPNTGFPAWNTGLAFPLSRGHWLSWIFDDCEWDHNHLKLLVEYMNKAGAEWGYAKAKCHTSDGKSFLVGDPFDRKRLLDGNNHIPNSAVLVKRTLIEDLGWYDPHLILKRNCDWDLWCRLSAKFIPHHLDHVISEEHGAKLSDSLGNAYSVFPEMCKAYAATDRTEKLRAENFHRFDRFDRSFFADMGDEALASFFFLEAENAFQTNDLSRLISIGEYIARNSRENIENVFKRNPDSSLDLIYLHVALRFFHRNKSEKIVAERGKIETEYASLLSLHNDVTEHVYDLRRVIESYEKQSQQFSTRFHRAVWRLRLRWRAKLSSDH